MPKEHIQLGTRDIFPTRVLWRDLAVINGYLSSDTRAVSVAYYIYNDDITGILAKVQHFEDLVAQGLLPADVFRTRILNAHISLYREPAGLILRAGAFVKTGEHNNLILELSKEMVNDSHRLSRTAQQQEISFDQAKANQEKTVAVFEAEEFLLLTRLGGMLEKGKDLEAIDFAADSYIVQHRLNGVNVKTVRRGQKRFHQLYDPLQFVTGHKPLVY